jgi:hypothetical protein
MSITQHHISGDFPDELRSASGPDADDYWRISALGGDSWELEQWDNSATTLRSRFEIAGTGTGVTDDGDIWLRRSAGGIILHWDESDLQLDINNEILMNANIDMGLWDITFVGAIQTDVGPDASDYWEITTLAGGDNFAIQQWDNSGAVARSRIEVIGTGTSITNDGDITFHDSDGTVVLRWDSDVFEWKLEGGVEFNANGALIHSVNSIEGVSNSNLFIRPDDNRDLVLEDEGAFGSRKRIVIVGVATNKDDIEFYDADATNISLLWDNSDDRWEFKKPVVFEDGGGMVHADSGNAAVAINSTTDVTVETFDVLGVAIGDVVVAELTGTILNNSGGTRTYTITPDFDNQFDPDNDIGSIATSSTNRAALHVRWELTIRSAALAEMYAHYRWAGADAAGVWGVTDQSEHMWDASTADLTGTITTALKIRSSSATATQEFLVHSFVVKRYPST